MAVTWLHVSDFHLSSKALYDSDVVFDALVESVEWFRLNTEWKPDLIFATGDIAGKGDVKVFEGGKDAIATNHFDALLEAAGQKDKRERLFIVPGNHDIERKKGIGLIRTIEEGVTVGATRQNIHEYFQQSPKYHFNKLEAFASWYDDYFSSIPIPRRFPMDSTCELISCEINKVRLELLHMNSTLFCKDAETDEGRLCIGSYCLGQQISELKKKKNIDFAIALMHHPFRSLHAKCERLNIKKLLQNNVNIFLHGHDHQIDIEQGDTLLQLGAGAAYLDEGAKRAFYCRYDGVKIDVFPICYQEESAPAVWDCDLSVFNHQKTKSFPVQRRTSQPSTSVVLPATVGPHDIGYESYRASLVKALDLAPSPLVHDFSAKVSDIFVSLRLSDTWRSEQRHTSEPKRSEQRQDVTGDSPEEVMSLTFSANQLFLVIGDPGSGKTTLLKHYALCCLDEKRCKPFGFTEPVKVFYLPLRELKKSDTEYFSLPANICSWSEKRNVTIPETVFSRWLEEKKTLVLLDGLDEISELEERKKVCAWIDKTITDFPNACFVVTSRPTGYRSMDFVEIKAPSLRADILDFDDKQKQTFLEQWFTAFLLDKISFRKEKTKEGKERKIESAHSKATAKAALILDFLQKDENKSLRQLAGIPLLLQIMAMLWNMHDSLPDSSVKLYKKALDYLLGYQYMEKKKLPLLAVTDAVKVLSPVALWMQEELESDEADKEKMKARLQMELENPKLSKQLTAKEFCDDLINHAGLLVECGDPEYDVTEYAFCHKSFREYLAAARLMKNPALDLSVQTLIDHFNDAFWEEPIRYFFGLIDEKSFDTFMHSFFDTASEEVIQGKQALLRTIIEETPKGKRKIDALCKKLLDPATTLLCQRVILVCLQAINKPAALDALEQFRVQQHAKATKDNKEILSRTEDLILLFGGKALETATEKSVSGNLLSFRNQHEQKAEYILIPGGSYIYSLTEKEEKVNDLYVAKYPVTNRLYRSFIASLQGKGSPALPPPFRAELEKIAQSKAWGEDFSGYHNEGKNDLAALFRSEYDEERKFDGGDQPVVGITWYAARAYCLWLSLLAGETGIYRLPTEVEWEWAAGGKQGTTGQKVREYPWADKKGAPSPALANYNRNVGQTTPVSNYPEGATPEGVYDMAGNIWEWMDNIREGYAQARALRGGSWVLNTAYLRCSARNLNFPQGRSYDFGFRVVRSSPLPENLSV